MEVWYLVPSLDPEVLVAVRWEPVRGSFVARVEGVFARERLDPIRPTGLWFGSHHGELQTVEDLQAAIGDYAVLGSGTRAALTADRVSRADQPRWTAKVQPQIGHARLMAARGGPQDGGRGSR